MLNRFENLTPMLILESSVTKGNDQVSIHRNFLDLNLQGLKDLIGNVTGELSSELEVLALKFLDLIDDFVSILVLEGLVEPNVGLLAEVLQVEPEIVSNIILLLEVSELLDLRLGSVQSLLVLLVAVKLTHRVVKVFLDTLELLESILGIGLARHKGLTREFFDVLSNSVFLFSYLVFDFGNVIVFVILDHCIRLSNECIDFIDLGLGFFNLCPNETQIGRED